MMSPGSRFWLLFVALGASISMGKSSSFKVCESLCQCLQTSDDVTIECSRLKVHNTTDIDKLEQVRKVSLILNHVEFVEINDTLCHFPNIETLLIQTEEENVVFNPPCTLEKLNTLWIQNEKSVYINVTLGLNISEISLSGSNLSVVPVDMLNSFCGGEVGQTPSESVHRSVIDLNCKHLQNLNLSHNLIREIPNNTFDSLSWVQVLDLSHNLLQGLDASSFGVQFRGKVMRDLNLSHNQIELLPVNVLTELDNLKRLDFSHNLIKKIDSGVFTCTLGNSLNILDLSYNKLVSLDPETLVDLRHLQVLNLSHNHLTYIADNAVLENNSVSCPDYEINKNLLWPDDLNESEEKNLVNIIWPEFHTLDVSYNNLSWVGSDTLKGPLRNLQVLLASHNQITHIPHYAVERLRNLRHLDLSYNNLFWLDVGSFNNDKLEYLDLSHNQLKKIISMAFLYLPRIHFINLSENGMNYIYKFAFYRTCKHDQQFEVSLKSNELETDTIWRLLSTFRHLEHTSCQLTVDLSYNNITHFVKDVDRVYELYLQTNDFRYFAAWNHVKFNLRFNPIVCDCTLYNEVKLLSHIRYAFRANISQLENLDFWKVLNCSNVDDESVPAVLDRMKCMDNHLTGHCPHNCMCHHEDRNLLVVNCTGQFLTEVPVLPHASFIELHLAHNRIFELLDEHYLQNVTLIDLSHNALENIASGVLQHMPHLQTLLLHSNKLHHLPVAIETVSNLTHVTIHDNPLICSCEDKWLHLWALNNTDIFPDLDKITCKSGRHLVEEYFCSDEASAYSSNTHLLYLGVSALAAILVLLTGLCSLLLCRKPEAIKNSLFSAFNGLLWRKRKMCEKDYRFDILLSYNSEDCGQFVDSVMSALLDMCPSLTVAAPLTSSRGQDQEVLEVRERVGGSRCTAIFLSRTFITREWPANRAAYLDMLHCGAHNIVFVTHGPLYSRLQQVSPELHAAVQDYPLLQADGAAQCATKLLSHIWDIGPSAEHSAVNASWDPPAEDPILVTPNHERY